MPVTRSQKSSKRREQSTTEAAIEEDTSASTIRATEGAGSMREMETGSTTTTTGATQVAVTASSYHRQGTVGESEEHVSGDRDELRVVVERNPSRPASKRSSISSRKRRECQAQIELARKEFEVAQQLAQKEQQLARKELEAAQQLTRKELEAAQQLTRKELEAAQQLAQKELQIAKLQADLAQLDEEDEEVLSEIEEPDDREKCTREWVERTAGNTTSVHPARVEERPTINSFDGAKGKSSSGTNELIEAFVPVAEAMMKVIDTKSTPQCGHSTPPPPPTYMLELPYFDGNCSEWLAFETVYKQTAPLFSDIVNLTRLRKVLKGTAREAVKSLLFSTDTPSEVMEALKRRFGRSDVIVVEELKRLKNIPKINDDYDLCVFASQVNNTVAAIRGLGESQYLHSPETVDIIEDKMSELLKSKWCDFLHDNKGNGDPVLILLTKFLNEEAEKKGKFATRASLVKKVNQKHSTHAVTQVQLDQKVNSKCPHCEGNHRLSDCRKFQQASVDERWDIAKSTRICFKCLQSTHRRENCRKTGCKTCRGWHHFLLHVEKKVDEDKKEVTNNIVLPVNSAKTSRAYLKMVPVKLFGPKGSIKVLALLDEGSTVTLLDSAVAKEIGVQGTRKPITLEAVGGKIITMENSVITNLKIKGLHQRRKRDLLGVRTIDGINLTPQGVDKKMVEECAHLRHLVKELSYEEEKPRLLIGQDNWQLIVSRSTKKGKNNQPVASLTYLGWVLHGSDGEAAKLVNFVTCAHVRNREQDLDKMMKEHFAIESMGVQPRRPSTDAEGRALSILEKTSKRLQDGRFEVGLLWKNDNEKMPNNYEYARTRLNNIEKKLNKDAELKDDYEKQIKNLLDNGYAEEVTHESASERKWYLPHFAVTHPTKKKKRLVFDAAAKYGGKSLNDVLLPGPDLLQSLFGVLLRFRQKPIAVVADIKEMFLQIRIKEEDRDSLRFLWRGNQQTRQPKEYRMTSVIFGAACSPSTAIYVKNKNAEEFRERYPEAVSAIDRNHYMDDYLHSFENENEAVRISKEVDTIHKQAGFVLRGWASNAKGVLEKLAQEEKTYDEVELGSKEEKTLGLRWFTEQDEMGFRTSLRNIEEEVISLRRTPTKREVTSAVMSTFDPMGLASPVLIQGKRLLQDIWRSGIGWDENIKSEEVESWKAYVENLQLLRDLRIPRCVTYSNNEGELHIFTDASETAYACAVYWRQKVDGKCSVALLAGKARVAPLRPISIPRLELQAALLGTRLAHSVEEELDLIIKSKTYWTDSSTVLSWIKTDPRTFKPFVAHRLAEIEDTTRPQEWRWVPTKDNPADDATRGIPKNFTGNHRWYTGPDFLQNDEAFWPKPRTFKAEPTEEERQSSIQSVTALKMVDQHPTPNPIKFSSWIRLRRATARVFQFVDLCRRKKESVNVTKKQESQDPTWKKNPKKARVGLKYTPKKCDEKKFLPLEPVHMEQAEKLLLKRSQDESFREEISLIKQKKPLSLASKLRRLDTMEEDGLLRVHGRIDAALGLEKSYKRPVVLDSKHHITKLLIAYYHEKFNHGNHATVMNEIRQRYWILGLRSAVRTITHSCQWCRVYRSVPLPLPTGDLPRERLQFGETPFTCTAVDYFGPMFVTVGRRHEKRWGVLFTCLTTRAVHIEIAASLSSDSMIMALRRMASRRGTPRSVFSDNGTNFIRANKELKAALEDLKKEELVTKAEELGIQWKFIPPGAPNMGGAWERLVRSIKTALAVTLKERYPKEEVLQTLLLEAEHIVNSRPLVSTEENTAEEALTPNHFLIGRSCGAPRIGSFTDAELSGKRTWKVAQRLADHFWSRWVKEYLPTLLPRKINGKREARDIQIGDVVLIVDSTLPRCIWPRGEVVGSYPGPDGRTRVVDVRTPGGILKRPCSKIVMLVPREADEHGIAKTGVGATHEGEDVGDRDNRATVSTCVSVEGQIAS